MLFLRMLQGTRHASCGRMAHLLQDVRQAAARVLTRSWPTRCRSPP